MTPRAKVVYHVSQCRALAWSGEHQAAILNMAEAIDNLMRVIEDEDQS